MIVCFSGLGLGFMFIEVAVMQKFVLFLGHPSYSISVVLAGLLLASGVGSFIAGKLRWKLHLIVLFTTLGVAAAALVYLAAIPLLFNLMIGSPLYARIIIASVMIAPLGVLMGMPFPSSLACIRESAQHFVPWAFGVNGAASVVASVLCIIIAMSMGFAVVLGLAAGVYIAGGIALYSLANGNKG